MASKKLSELIGFFIYDTGAPKCCAAAGNFAWFTCPAEAVAFTLDIMDQVIPEEDLPGACQAANQLLQECKGGKVKTIGCVCRRLSSILDPYVAFSWSGTFSELCKEKSEFAQQVIEGFLINEFAADRNADPPQRRPMIPKDL